jgi:hypothetical protein
LPVFLRRASELLRLLRVVSGAIARETAARSASAIFCARARFARLGLRDTLSFRVIDTVPTNA